MEKVSQIAAYPLQWPEGWKRSDKQETARFKIPSSKAYENIRAEITRMGGYNIVISTNLALKADGTPRLDREPVDPGVAVYFTRDDKGLVFACDQYESLRANLTAIAKTIEAMRGIERWGASEILERMFTGFKQLPAEASAGEDCWTVLMIPAMSDERLIRLTHRDLIRNLHATGSSSEDFARVNVARDDALAALAAAQKVTP